MRTAYVQL